MKSTPRQNEVNFLLIDPWHEPGHRGKLPNEVPFRPDISLANPTDLEARLGLSPLRSRSANAARIALLANIKYAVARGSDCWVFYSRDRDFYPSLPRRRSHDWFFHYQPMILAVQDLEKRELIDHRKTAPSPFAEYRSRLRASKKLIENMGPTRVEDFVFSPPSPIILRDVEGNTTDFEETPRLRRLRCDVEQHNEFLSRFEVSVAPPAGRYDENGFLFIGHLWFNPLRKVYYRVFNGNFRSGGRWYGPFWQGMPSHARQSILIEGRPTVERDFRSCHPRLLAAIANLDLPFSDPKFDFYGGGGDERKQNKLAFNIGLNARSRASALSAIAQRFREEGFDQPVKRAATSLESMLVRYPGMSKYLNTGVGLSLQYLDAEICTRIQRQYRELGVPCLSVHDSFIVWREQMERLDNIMGGEFDRALERLRKQSESTFSDKDH